MGRVFMVICGLILSLSASSEISKVAGNYLVKSIEPKNDGMYLIKFEAQEKSHKLDYLELLSDHIHFGVESGSVLRISGEIANVRTDGVAELRQVMVLLPSREGATPIWMLSKKFPSHGLHGAKYIDMHAPNADFLVF